MRSTGSVSYTHLDVYKRQLLVLYVIITVIRNIIEPRIVGAQIGLHPVLTRMSMFVGNHRFGIVGLFGLPILLSLLRYLNDNGGFTGMCLGLCRQLLPNDTSIALLCLRFSDADRRQLH